MYHCPKTHKDHFTSAKRIESWHGHEDPYMVVLSTHPEFLAVEVLIAHLSSFNAGSRKNSFLASHGWAKSFLHQKKGQEVCQLKGLTKYLSANPRQTALLLESEHILLDQNSRVERLRRAYGYFVGNESQGALEGIEGYLDAVNLCLEERRYDEKVERAAKRSHLVRLKKIIERVAMLKAQQGFDQMVDRVKAILVFPAKANAEIAGKELRHWKYLVSPLE